MAPEKKLTYLCPIRTTTVNYGRIDEFKKYWDRLNLWGCDVVVIDGSPPSVFEEHKKSWSNCRHYKVDNSFGYLNGKVNGIWTGIPLANCEKIILADDDIVYEDQDLERMNKELDIYEVVRPQNYFFPEKPWSHIDSARILCNRITFKEGDFPGTIGFRKQVIEKAGHFDGDALFDNEEIVRHLQNKKANINFAIDFFIKRRPPGFNKWLEQRPRQAYEDFDMKKRSAFFFSVIPALGLLTLFGKNRGLLYGISLLASISILQALLGRKAGAKKFFPPYIALFAPLWVLERSISIYVALYWKIVKGGCPFGDRIISKSTGADFKLSLEEKRNNF